jgi:hypothetical protein
VIATFGHESCTRSTAIMHAAAPDPAGEEK